jgi:hypothetical protein
MAGFRGSGFSGHSCASLTASLGGWMCSADTDQGAVGEVKGEQDASRDHVVEVSEWDKH